MPRENVILNEKISELKYNELTNILQHYLCFILTFSRLLTSVLSEKQNLNKLKKHFKWKSVLNEIVVNSCIMISLSKKK